MSYEVEQPTDTQIESEAEDRWWAEQEPCCEHAPEFHYPNGKCVYVDPIMGVNTNCPCKGGHHD